MAHPLFVSDLDGTLLQPDGHLSAFAKAALTELTARGVPITVASGRAFSSIRRALGSTRLHLPVISSDGALISSFDSPAPLHLVSMDETPLEELIADLRAQGFSPLLDIWDGEDNFQLSEGPQNPVMSWFHDMKTGEEFYLWRHDHGLVIPPRAKTISVTLLDRPEWLDPLKEDLEERYGEWFKFDSMVMKDIEDGAALWVQHREARKENALEVLGQMLGYRPDDVIVFGDELNDLGMFGREWCAVAVGNAREELKTKAHEVIGHHADDSVLKYILENVSRRA